MALIVIAALSILGGAGGVSVAHAAPISPVYPQWVQGTADGIGTFEATLLTKQQTRTLYETGIARIAGELVNADGAVTRAMGPDGAGCVALVHGISQNFYQLTSIKKTSAIDPSNVWTVVFNERNFRCV